jgi:tetratricopeptide (TPR) repeat protein
MNVKVKLAAYVVLILLTAWFGRRFYANFHSGSGEKEQAAASPARKTKPTNEPPAVAATNAAGGTNLTAANTNGNDQTTNTTNAADQGATTNAVAQAPAPDPNQTAAAGAATDQDPATMAQTISGGHEGRTIVYLALLVVSAVALGLLVASDVTQLIGAKAGDYLYHDIADAQRDPEYEKAEQVWANGQHLEAIQMLRDYYKRNPRQVHAALRIAEIYEKDLRNYLAAALEYEEVLKHKLPSDRWAWAAIHLCNLYSRIGQQDKTMGLLRRIAEEHPRSAAAKKARQRLGWPEPGEAEAEAAGPASESGEEEETFDVSEEKGEWPTEAAPEPPRAEEPKSNLPPGFRPKK